MTVPNDCASAQLQALPHLRGVEVFAQFATDEPGIGFAVTQGGLVRVQ